MVECICIDGKNRPKEIPAGKWVSEGMKYHITHVYYHPLQGNVLACTLHEVRLGVESAPYETFRLNRFGVTEANLHLLYELAKACSELDAIDIKEIFDNAELITVEK